MSPPARRFDDASASGVYRASAAAAIESAARAAGLDVVRVELSGAAEKLTLLRAVAAALRFPDWFGENWDALEDCLTDLSWRPAGGYLLLFEGHERLSSEMLESFIEILTAAAQYWAGRGTRFFAVFIDPKQALTLSELGQ